MGENRFDKFVEWIFSKAPYELSAIDAADKFHKSMRTTAKCCYIASVRLQRQAKLSFFTAGFLTVGLILIPLIQNSNFQIAFAPSVLHMMQIFLGIAVLVYLVMIAMSKCDVRARQFQECEAKIKALIQAFNKERSLGFDPLTPARLDEFQAQYVAILAELESHHPNDYRFATLEMFRDYYITGLPRLKLYASAHIIRTFVFIIPVALMLIEIIFIADMVGATQVITPHLGAKVVDARLTHALSEVPADAASNAP
jgi:hypothetical protein